MKTIADYKKIVENRNGVDYFNATSAERKADPKAFDDRYDQAINEGKNKAADFLNKVRDYQHSQHEATLKTFQTKYKSSPDAVSKDCIAVAVNSAGAKRIESRNAARESAILSKYKTMGTDGAASTCNYRISNDMDSATIAKFQALMTAAWDAEGYKNDTDIVSDFWNSHRMSTDPASGVDRLAPVAKHVTY